MPLVNLLDDAVLPRAKSKKIGGRFAHDEWESSSDRRQLVSPPPSPVIPKLTDDDLRNGVKLDFVKEFGLEAAIGDFLEDKDPEAEVEHVAAVQGNGRPGNGEERVVGGQSLDQEPEKEKALKLSSQQIYDLTSSPKSLPVQASNDRVSSDSDEIRSLRSDARSRTIATPNRRPYEDTAIYPVEGERAHISVNSPFETEASSLLAGTAHDAVGPGRALSGGRTISTPLMRNRASTSKGTSSNKHSTKQNRGVPPPLRFEESNSATRHSPLDGPQPSPMPHSIPAPPLSLPTYLQLELSSEHPSPLYIHRSVTSDFPYESSRVKIERLKNFMLLPPQLEQVLWFGALACMDAWLYSFTILPLRFIKALSILIHSWSRNALREGREILSDIYSGSGRMWERHRRGSAVTLNGTTRGHDKLASVTTPTKETTEHITNHTPEPPQQRPRRLYTRHLRTKSMPSLLQPDHKADLLKGLLILLSTTILMYFDASRMYHGIRGQAAIKLYVIYNVLEVCDRLFSALGQDVLECLFSKETLERKADGRSKVLRPFWLFLLALVYNLVHSTALFYQVITLNVAVNSYSNALLTLLMSNQFVEIKSTVFKKFEKENLFQLTCADVVERFQLWLMLMIIASRNIVETGGLTLGFFNTKTSGEGTAPSSSSILPSSFTLLPSWSGQVLAPFFIVLGSEMLVDWIKHSYITKFNNTKPAIYGRFLDVLTKDYYSNAFADQNLTRRLGLPVVPLACLFIRASVQTYHMFLATYAPSPISSTATSLSIESATTSPATTAALAHIDNLFRHALYHSAPSQPSAWPYYILDSLLPYLVPFTTLLLLFIVLLSIKVLLGMALLSFARSRYQSMKEREKNGVHAEGRRVGGWGVVEVDEDKRRWIYADDPEGAKRLREREARDNERIRSGQQDDFGGVSRYSMVAKRIW